MSVKILIYLFLLCSIINNCEKSKPIESSEKFEFVVKEMQIILSSQAPDSIKYKKIRLLFDTENVTIEEYQNLRREYMKNNPLKSISLLQNIEKLIRADMQKTVEDHQQ